MTQVIKAPVGVKGFFEVEVLSADGTIKSSTGTFPNLVLDTGLQRLASTSNVNVSFATLCAVGSGNTPPSPGDQALQNQLASQSGGSVSNSNNLEGGYCQLVRVWTFGLGDVVGNISELGVGWSASSGGLFSRALILDQFGNPTSITILADEQLRVRWTHRRYWPTEDVTGVLENEGNRGGVFAFTLRAAQVGSWSIPANTAAGAIVMDTSFSASRNRWFYGPASLGALTGTVSGSGTYTSGSGTRTAEVNSITGSFTLSLGQGNAAGGLGGLHFGTSNSDHRFQVVFDPPIPKTAEDLLAIDVEISWGRA